MGGLIQKCHCGALLLLFVTLSGLSQYGTIDALEVRAEKELQQDCAVHYDYSYLPNLVVIRGMTDSSVHESLSDESSG